MIPLLTARGASRLASRGLSWSASFLIPLAVAFAAGGLVMTSFGFDPLRAYSALLLKTLGSAAGLADTINEASPLVLTGLAVLIPYRAGLFNMGGQGQLFAGTIAAAWLGTSGALSGGVGAGLILVASAGIGAGWAAIPGVLRAWRGAHEVITTLMGSYIALFAAQFMLRSFLADPNSSSGSSAALPNDLWLATPLATLPQMHAGIVIALAAAVLGSLFLGSTRQGFEIRAVGENATAAAHFGISVSRTTIVAMCLGGALAGLAGGVQILGLDHRLYNQFGGGLLGGPGFAGIAVAMMARGSALGIVPAAFVIGLLSAGGLRMQGAAGVPAELVQVLQGLIIFSAAIPVSWGRLRTLQARGARRSAAHEEA